MSSDLKFDALEPIKHGFESMEMEDVVIAPWLAMNRDERRLSSELEHRLREFAHELTFTYRDAEVLQKEPAQVSTNLREQAYYETLLSTAAYLSYMRLGTLVITAEMVSVSHSLIRKYLADNGASVLMSVYVSILSYLNTQLLLYYGRVPEAVFLSGEWHRPWIDYTLQLELEAGLRHGVFQRYHEDKETYIELTNAGKELYEVCLQELEECGYLRQREQLMRVSNFTHMEDYEVMLERALVDVHEIRKELIQSSEIQSGMTVLELGCGTGGLTLTDGLYQAVGEDGQLIATDPSVGMLERAKQKAVDANATNIVLRQGRAEHIPYPDNTFDAVIGMLFFHFTNMPKAFEEIRRVLRPGGTFTTLYVLDFNQKEDFFLEWFEPIFTTELAAKGVQALPQEDEVPDLASKYFENFSVETLEWKLDWSNVEDVVKFLIQAGTLAELNELPWEARTSLFRNLIDRGHAVKAKYGPEAMQRVQSGQWFRGTVTKK